MISARSCPSCPSAQREGVRELGRRIDQVDYGLPRHDALHLPRKSRSPEVLLEVRLSEVHSIVATAIAQEVGLLIRLAVDHSLGVEVETLVGTKIEVSPAPRAPIVPQEAPRFVCFDLFIPICRELVLDSPILPYLQNLRLLSRS